MSKTNSKPNEKKRRQTHSDQSTLSDLELIKRIGEHKDRDALATLYLRYRLPLGRFLIQRQCEQKLLDEVYNDVMHIVWNNALNFKGNSKVSTWIFGIAYRVHMSHRRKECRHAHCDLSDVVDFEAAHETSVVFDSKSELGKAIDSLPTKQKSVIIHSYFFGYSTDEIAALEGCPQNTVKTRLYHARQKLKQVLIENEVDFRSSNSATNFKHSNLDEQTYYFYEAVCG